MFNKLVVQEALKNSWEQERNQKWLQENNDSEISLLVHDIFGGEILKTHKRKGWHFYNRIDGIRFDFTRPEKSKSADRTSFEDIPSTPEETSNYFEPEDYSTLMMRFVRAFEEAVGLEKYPTGLA